MAPILASLGEEPPYKELRMKKAATIVQQTLDYVTMFRYVLNPVMPFLDAFAYFLHKSEQELRDGQGISCICTLSPYSCMYLQEILIMCSYCLVTLNFFCTIEQWLQNSIKKYRIFIMEHESLCAFAFARGSRNGW